MGAFSPQSVVGVGVVVVVFDRVVVSCCKALEKPVVRWFRCSGPEQPA